MLTSPCRTQRHRKHRVGFHRRRLPSDRDRLLPVSRLAPLMIEARGRCTSQHGRLLSNGSRTRRRVSASNSTKVRRTHQKVSTTASSPQSFLVISLHFLQSIAIPPAFKLRIRYHCARNGDRPSQPRKHTDGKYDHKVESKKLGYGGCSARITAKTFLDRDDVLAKYESEHTHPVGASNTRFCRISSAVREFAEGLIRLGVELDKVMEQIDQ